MKPLDLHMVGRRGPEPLGPALEPSAEERTVLSATALPPAKEQYRHLASALHHAQGARGMKTIMVASAVAAEGKTLTAVNLALTLSESFRRRVLLIDADFRRPSLHRIFPGSPEYGLGDLLETTAELATLVPLTVTSRLSLLASGKGLADPMAALSSERMREVLAAAALRHDWVIIDTPPVGLFSDARLLATHADAALLVVNAGRTPLDLLERTVDAIGRDRILGVVLNRAEPRAIVGGSYHYNRYYGGYRAAAG
jgi:capsular exopolysaccharide synthesis family protein